MRIADLHELANIPEVLVLYRVHTAQVSLTRIERQALIALFARVSTDIRRKTGVDPLENCDAIDRSTLLQLGISEAEIDLQLVNAYVSCLSTMPQLGLAREALVVLREVAAHQSLRSALDLNVAEHGGTS
jgi:hypothetical protein